MGTSSPIIIVRSILNPRLIGTSFSPLCQAFDRDVFVTFVPGRTAVRVTELAAQLGRLEAETRSARSAAAVAEMRAEVRLWPSGRR